MAGSAHYNPAKDTAAGLAAAGRRVLNCQCARKYPIHLVVSGPDRGCPGCCWRGAAAFTDHAIPVGRRFRICPIFGAAERVVAKSQDVRALDRQLAPQRQH